MAIFHCSVTHGSRKGGQSGAAKVDYIMRSGKYIGDAAEVIGACAGHLPSWAGGNPRVFFAAADEYERSNGRLFTQVLFAIPNELSDEDALLLAYHIAEAMTGNGAPYALAVHRGGVETAAVETVPAALLEADEERLPPHNRHGHLMICERIDDGLERTAKEWFRRANRKEPALGGAAKDRAMNGGDWVPEVRRLCADYINYGLERAGFSERVTCESHETRIARAEAAGDEETAERLRLNPPGIHLGPTAWAIEKGRPGRPARVSWRGDLNRSIAAEATKLCGEVEELNARLGQLDVQEAGVNERLESARRVAAAQFERREKALQGTSIGEEILRAVQAETVGESAVLPSVVQRGEMLEAAEQRVGAALDLREEGFRQTSVGSRYLEDATRSILGAGQSPTLPQRERIIETAEGRLARDLDRREAALRASEGGADVLGAVQLEGAEEYGSVLTFVQCEHLVVTAERRLAEQEAGRRGDLDRREEALRSMSTGPDHLAAAARELFGEGEQAGTLADRGSLIGEAERRIEDELRGREQELRSVPPGAQYLSEAEQEGHGEGKGATVLAARAAIVSKAVQRLERELDSREQALVSSAGSDELLLTSFVELCAGDEDFGDGSALPERWRILELAERWHEEDRAEDAERSAVVDDLEGMLQETSAGARHLAAARQEVVDEGQEPSWLAARETVVRRAWSRVEREQDERKALLSERRCGGGWDDVDGAELYAMKLAELEEGEQQNDGPHPGRREQALAWAERQMDRVDALREAEALERVGRPHRPADVERSLGDAEKQQHEAAERRLERVAALSEDERRFFEEKLAALDPPQRENPKPSQVDAALVHARARVAALDEAIERRRAVIEQTPGDGYARLLTAGFAKASRQQKVEALTAMETALAEDFDRREEEIRSAGAGEAFLRRARREVLGDAERQPETLPERGRVIETAEVQQRPALAERAEERRAQVERLEEAVRATKNGPGWRSEAAKRVLRGADRQPTLDERERIAGMVEGWIRTNLDRRQQELRSTEDGAWFLEDAWRGAGAVETLAAEEQLVDAAQDRLRAFQEAEARRSARQQRLFQQPGGEDLYYAVLTALDPTWRDEGKTAVENINSALTAAESDTQRLGRLRDVLADPADAVHYREVLGARGEQFTVRDIDAAIEAVHRWREEAQRKREKEAERKRKAEERRATRRAALSPAGRELFAAWSTDLAPAGRRRGGPSPQVVDQALDATESDGRLPRLEVALQDAEQWSYYRGALGAAVGPPALERIDTALHAAETFASRRNTLLQYPGGGQHPSGKELWAAACQTRPAAGQPDAAATPAALDGALAQVASQLGERVRQAADEAEKLLPTTRPYPQGRPHYRVPALSDERFDQLAASRADAFAQAVVAEVRRRYAHRARYDTRAEDRYGPGDRLTSEQAHLAGDIEMTWDRARRLWTPSSSSPRPTRSSALARVLKRYLSKVWEIFRVACDKILGGDLGERLRRRREQVERAADAAERLLPATPSGRGELRVPVASDKVLAGVVTDKTTPFMRDVVELVWERYDHRSRPEVPYEQRYSADNRETSEQAYLAAAVELRRSLQDLTLADARTSVLAGHQSHLREIFEVACDEVVGQGELSARWRRWHEQVERAADAAERLLPTTQPEPYRPNRHVPAVSNETLKELIAAETDPPCQAMLGVVWERYHRRARLETPYEERCDADDRRRSEQALLHEVIEQTLAQQRQEWLSSAAMSERPTLASARASVLQDYRSRIRHIFITARDDVLRGDEQRGRQPAQSARPAGTSTERSRAGGEPPPESPPAPSAPDRTPGKGVQEPAREANQDSTPGRGPDTQGAHRRPAAVPASPPAAVSVTEADRIRLAVHLLNRKLPRTTPYSGNSTHRPPAVSNERFNGLAAATDDDFIRKAIASLQKATYYSDSERTKSEEEHLRATVGSKHKEALAQYETAEATRGIFSRRAPKPTWEDAKAAVVKEFEADLLSSIAEVCREVRQMSPAAVLRELERFSPAQAPTRRTTPTRTRYTSQQDRNDTGPSR